MQGSIGRADQSRYIAELDAESEDQQRDQLHSLLIAAEDRFGGREERLQNVRLCMVQLQARVLREWVIIDRLRRNGADSRAAEQRLSNMSTTLNLLAEYRDRLLEAAERDTPAKCLPRRVARRGRSR